MYKFIHRIIEIKNILDHLWLIETVLDIGIILLGGFLFIPYMAISPYWINAPIFLYLVISLRYKLKINTVALIEEKYPELNERLRTIYDNKDQKNIVLENLAESVLVDIEKIKYSTFFETKRLGIRIVIVLLLITILISSSIYSPLYYQQKTDQNKILSSALTSSTESRKTDENIFNEPSFIRIENDSQGLIVYRGSGNELNVPGTSPKNPATYPAFPQDADIVITPSQAYSEAIPVIYQQIVKNYFMNISRE